MQVTFTRKIVILGTGGTIAGQGVPQGGSVGYRAGQIDVAQLVRSIAVGSLRKHYALEAEQVAQLDSKDMDIATWQQLATACDHCLSREDVAGVVVTHGTDTLEETAWFLQCVLQPCKPVVLTCAMRPATALSPDGPANLRDALVCAAQNMPGVWVSVSGEVHSAQWLRKVHPYRVNAFSSEPYGPAAWIEEGSVRWACNSRLASAVPSVCLGPAVSLFQNAQDWPWVEIVHSTAAAHPGAVDALVAAGVRGLVVAGTGNGSIHQALLPALERAARQGVVIWRATRCEQGQIVQADGVADPAVTPLSPVKARISLMLFLLQCGSSIEERQA